MTIGNGQDQLGIWGVQIQIQLSECYFRMCPSAIWYYLYVVTDMQLFYHLTAWYMKDKELKV